MFAAMKSGQPMPAATPAPSYSEHNGDGGGGGARKPQAKVFNIPEGTAVDDLKEFFSSVAELGYVKILPARDGKTTTMGFVEFDNEADVQKAVDEKNDSEFNGSNLRVMVNDRSGGGGGGSSSGGGGGQNVTSNQVKVFNIPEGSSQDELKTFLSDAGEILNMKVLPCREGKDVTLGFVTFSNVDGAKSAIEKFNNADFNGSQLRIMGDDKPPLNGVRDEAPSRPMGRGAQLLANANRGGGGGSSIGQRRPQAKIFGFPEGTSQDDVKDFFATAGEVKYVKLLPIREGKDTHLGFVEFDTSEEVNKAIELFDGTDFNGSSLKVMEGTPQQNNNMPRLDSSSPWNSSNGPTSRIPNEERPSLNGMRDESYMVPDYQNNQCRRCGETGHMQRECLNAPISDGSMVMAVTYIPPAPPETEEEIFQQGIHEGINFEKYEAIPVELTGNNPPAAVAQFADAKLHQQCMENIKRAEYTKPTPVQKYALPAILAQRDLMACAQTGSGKTASFLLPVITNLLNAGVSNISDVDGAVTPLAAIMSPTRELAVQIFKEARKFSFNTPLKVCVVYGGVSVAHQTDRLRMGCHLLVATPGRLNDFVKRGKVSFKNLKYLILDEADRMLDMGFGPQIDDIIDNSEMPPKGQRSTLMFSATFPESIQQMAAQFLNDYLFLTVGRVGGTCSDVQQSIIEVEGSNKRNTLEKILQESGTDRTLVFVERKRDADFLASFLSQRNYPATSLNADRTQQERESALSDFREGIAPVLVATAVAGRGLDINDVKHVINYDLPNDATEYVHRIGRTGRIGNKGKATSFFDAQRDDKLARGLVKLLSEAEQEIPDWLEQCALAAVGTGYGPDGGNFRDRRERYNQNGGVPNGGGGSRFQTSGASAAANAAAVINDEDDEW